MEAIKPTSWNTLAPQFEALLATELTSTDVIPWLHRWSDLEKIVWEARAHLKKAKSLDITNQIAQQAFNDFTAGTFSHFKFATQQLISKHLNLATYRPAPQYIQLQRRWRNEADLFCAANVQLQAEIDILANSYDALAQAVDEGEASTNSSGDDAHGRNQRWLERRKQFDDLFLQLLRLRRQVADNAGLSDYRAYRWREMGRLDYTPEMCLVFHEAVATELMPLARSLVANPSSASGPKRLRQSVFPTTSAFETGMQSVLTSVDPDLGTLFTQMRAGFLDLGKRSGKAGGSEEWIFPVTALPYVRVNADGTGEGISLLLHECGHAFHDFLSLRDQNLIWNIGGATEFEEFTAIALSYLALPHLHHAGVYSAAEMEQALADQIEEAIVKWVPHIARVDAFQHWLYTQAPENVQPADLDAQWIALTKRFQPDADKSTLTAEDAIGWQQVGLLFKVPFYYIEYALAHLGALQLWQKMDADPVGTWEAYRTALTLGNTRPLPELYATAGAKLPFDPLIMRELIQAVAAHLNVQIST